MPSPETCHLGSAASPSRIRRLVAREKGPCQIGTGLREYIGSVHHCNAPGSGCCDIDIEAYRVIGYNLKVLLLRAHPHRWGPRAWR